MARIAPSHGPAMLSRRWRPGRSADSMMASFSTGDRVMTTPSLPLNGFTVIALTPHPAGPTAVRQLADWGADVIKIEMPGEHTDATGSRRDGPDFQNLHRNKRALSLNLKSNEGPAIFMKLAEKADVIIENFKST